MISAPKSYPLRLLPLRLPRVCVAVAAPDPTELIQKAEGLIRDNSFLEFRLDHISKPGLAIPKIKHFLETHSGVMVIATCRRVAGGGKFRGSVASQLDILGKAAAAGCQLADVELQTAQKCKPEQLQKLRSRTALILSFHDFRGTRSEEHTSELQKGVITDESFSFFDQRGGIRGSYGDADSRQAQRQKAKRIAFRSRNHLESIGSD